MNDAPTPAQATLRASAAQITHLLTWARSLTGHHNQPGSHPDPDERCAEQAAFLAAKHELLAHINQHQATAHDTGHDTEEADG